MSDIPNSPSDREKLESRITAYLLGELAPEEAEAIQRQIEASPELAALRRELSKTIEWIRSTMGAAEPEKETEPGAAMQLDAERREALLKAFQGKAAAASDSKAKGIPWWDKVDWTQMAAVLVLGLLLIGGLMLPNLSKAKAKRVAHLANESQSHSYEPAHPEIAPQAESGQALGARRLNERSKEARYGLWLEIKDEAQAGDTLTQTATTQPSSAPRKEVITESFYDRNVDRYNFADSDIKPEDKANTLSLTVDASSRNVPMQMERAPSEAPSRGRTRRFAGVAESNDKAGVEILAERQRVAPKPMAKSPANPVDSQATELASSLNKRQSVPNRVALQVEERYSDGAIAFDAQPQQEALFEREIAGFDTSLYAMNGPSPAEEPFPKREQGVEPSGGIGGGGASFGANAGGRYGGRFITGSSENDFVEPAQAPNGRGLNRERIPQLGDLPQLGRLFYRAKDAGLADSYSEEMREESLGLTGSKKEELETLARLDSSALRRQPASPNAPRLSLGAAVAETPEWAALGPEEPAAQTRGQAAEGMAWHFNAPDSSSSRALSVFGETAGKPTNAGSIALGESVIENPTGHDLFFGFEMTETAGQIEEDAPANTPALAQLDDLSSITSESLTAAEFEPLQELEERREAEPAVESEARPNLLTPKPEVQTRENAFSTFSLNVSDVSFKTAEAGLDQNQMPDPQSIRSEEFLNAMDYRDPKPAGEDRIAFHWEAAGNPFAHNRQLLRLSVQTADAGRHPQRPLNLVLLLDSSGSMNRQDRVQIVRNALRVLAEKLKPQDRISVVAFSRTPRLWVDGLEGGRTDALLSRVASLQHEGGTHLESSLDLAYQTAQKHFNPEANNRVLLMTDGAANLGDVDPDSLRAKVIENRRKGVALDCFGVGWEGYNDSLLESLARNGDGRYAFLNDPENAGAEFADKLAGAFQVMASDVKVQVEFHPDRVRTWRQIGYDLHQLTKEQFRDNRVDAAEIGSAETGNALYSIQTLEDGEGPVATARVRYKIPGTQLYREREWLIPYYPSTPPLDQSSPSMRLAAVSTLFAEWLAKSPHAGLVRLDDLESLLRGVPEIYSNDRRPALLAQMIRQARRISGE